MYRVTISAVILLVFGCDHTAPQAEYSPPGVDADLMSGDAGATSADAAMLPDETTVAPPEVTITYTEEREVCARRIPTRSALFGDFHVHTSFSFDAGAYSNVLTPSDAYAFARGETVFLPPLDDQGRGTRPITIDRPLDFLAVTDHADLLGEVALCTEPSSAAYPTRRCISYRDPEDNGAFNFGVFLASPTPQRDPMICGADLRDCAEAAHARWLQIQEETEASYDRSSACTLTTFVGYEYTNTRGVSNLHRNVIFRNRNVPASPVTYFEASRPLDLWRQLKRECLDQTAGCDVLSLPHNSNLSNGQLFYPRYPDAETLEEEAEVARLRAALEPIAEIFQHKGDSECRLGFEGDPQDPLCSFEKLRPPGDYICPDESPGGGGMRLTGCVHTLDFLRHVLLRGLMEWKRLGVNPYILGFIGSTDTHNGTPGHVSASEFQGHIGIVDDTPVERLGEGNVTHDGIINNPGGLVGVWAFENSRDAIFDALRRRETFATSGPRIEPRLFIGADLPDDLCDRPDRLERGYAQGHPMGSVVTLAADETPHLFVEALADEGGAQTPLERLQIIKGWLDAEGKPHWSVFDVAGDTRTPESVPSGDCAPLEVDATRRLCAVWRDPDFDPALPAFYYLRAIEAPTCRWSARQCQELAETDRPPTCGDPVQTPRVRHRAWSSPVWHTP